MEHWLLIGGKVASLAMAAGAGYWFARLGTNWDARMISPLVLSFAAFLIGSVAWGDPAADGGFQLNVWLTLGGAVLVGVALAKFLPQRRLVKPLDGESSSQTNVKK